MDWDTLTLLNEIDFAERDLAVLNNRISLLRSHVKLDTTLQGRLNLALHRRKRILGSVPVYGMYCHIKSRTTQIKM